MVITKSLDYDVFIRHIDKDGFITFDNTSISTLYRWTKQLNKYLEDNNYDYRFKVDSKAHRIYKI